MRILMLDRYCPGAFRLLGSYLAGLGHDVVCISEFRRKGFGQGLRTLTARVSGGQRESGTERVWLTLLRRGEAFRKEMLALKAAGFVPDVLLGNSADGSSVYAHDVFSCPQLVYFPWFFSPEASVHPEQEAFMPLRLRNMFQLDAAVHCTQAVTGSAWQRASYPAWLRERIAVQPEGVDTSFFSPETMSIRFESSGAALEHFHAENALLTQARQPPQRGVDSGGKPTQRVPRRGIAVGECNEPYGYREQRDVFPQNDALKHSVFQKQNTLGGKAGELITFTARNLSGNNGAEVLFAALPAVLQLRPQCHALIVTREGQERVSPLGQALRAHERVHFLNLGNAEVYRGVLRASTVHVFLSAPVMLSASLLEAMSCGCLVLASDTPPVREVITDGVNGLLTPFPDARALTAMLYLALENRQEQAALRQAARNTITERYSSSTLLPRLAEIVISGARL